MSNNNKKNMNNKNNTSNAKSQNGKGPRKMDESKTSMEGQSSSEEGYEGYIAKAGEIYHQVAAHVDGMLGYEDDAKYHTNLLEEGKAGDHAIEKFQEGKEKVSELVDQAKEKIQGAQEIVKGKVEETREKAKGKMEEAKEKIQGAQEKVKGKVEETREKAKGKMEEAKGKMEETKEKVKGKVEETREKAKGKMEETKEKAKGKVQQAKQDKSKDEFSMFDGLSDDEEREIEGGHFNVGKTHKGKSHPAGSISSSDLSKTSGIPQSQLNEAPSNDHIHKETKNFHELGKRDEKHKLSNILHKSKPDEQLPENQRNHIGENDENKRYNTGNYVTEPVDYTTGKMKGPADKLKGHDSHFDKSSHVASVGETDFDSDFDQSKSSASSMNKQKKHQKTDKINHVNSKAFNRVI